MGKRKRKKSKSDLRSSRSDMRSSRSNLRSSRSNLRSGRGSRANMRGSRANMRGSRTNMRGSRMSMRGSRTNMRGSRTNMRGSRMSMRGSRTSMRPSRTNMRGSRANLRGSRMSMRGSRANMRGSRMSMHGGSRMSMHGSRANIHPSMSRSQAMMMGSQANLQGRMSMVGMPGGRSAVTLVQEESRWSLTPRGKMAKYGLFSFNMIFLLTGAAILGIGVWLKLDASVRHFQTAIHGDPKNYLYIEIATYVTIGIGLFVVCVSFVGCIGACSENKTVLTTYVVCLVVIYAGEIAIGVIVAMFKGEAFKNAQSTVYNSFTQEQFNIEAYKKSWDFVQIKLKCCGVNNYLDYKKRNISISKSKKAKQIVPPSCCVMQTFRDWNYASSRNPTACHNQSLQEITDFNQKFSDFYPKGCFDRLNEYINKNFTFILAVISVIVFIELMGIILACCMCYSRIRLNAMETLRRYM